MAYESWIDRQIREAQERGAFDNLRGAGQPLRDFSRDGEDWFARGLMERENLSPVLPTTLSLRREVEALPESLADVRFEHQVREVIADLNERIRESYRRHSDGPRLIIRLVDEDEAVRGWRESRTDV